MSRLSASIVAYRSDPFEVRESMASLLACAQVERVFLVDNSPGFAEYLWLDDPRVSYLAMERNVGFATAHNHALRQALEGSRPYHLVINPDVRFERGTLEALIAFMDAQEDVGLTMPRVLYPDGSLQHLCKLLPTPLDLIRRRFLPSAIESPAMDRYELRFSGYDRVMDVPHLSGCFMFLRTAAIEAVGCFDERFFLYLEDVDLSRRIGEAYRTVYFPDVAVTHRHAQGSYVQRQLLGHHVRSALRYFWKWGFFVDRGRDRANQAALDALTRQGRGVPGSGSR